MSISNSGAIFFFFFTFLSSVNISCPDVPIRTFRTAWPVRNIVTAYAWYYVALLQRVPRPRVAAFFGGELNSLKFLFVRGCLPNEGRKKEKKSKKKQPPTITCPFSRSLLENWLMEYFNKNTNIINSMKNVSHGVSVKLLCPAYNSVSRNRGKHIVTPTTSS